MYKLKKNLDDFSYKKIDLKSSRVLIRSCLNVVVDEEGRMTDLTRFYESLPLIKEAFFGAKSTVVMAHLGRPEERSKALSFWHIREVLEDELKSVDSSVKVELIEEINEESIRKVNEADGKTLFLLDNIRFFDGEESKDKAKRTEFATTLAKLGDVFINDAFADYREAASTYEIAEILPAFLGPVFLREVQAITKLSGAEKPFVAVVGGAKLTEKLDALNALYEEADKVLVGGAMAYTLLMAKGVTVGKSLIEENKIDVAKEIVAKFGDKLILPIDHRVADKFDKNEELFVVDDVNIPDGKVALDIGPKTEELFDTEIKKAATILWNGPLGLFEWEQSAGGTIRIGREVNESKAVYKVAGGGDTIAAINKFELEGFSHVSTGGGALLSLIAYDKFPTLDVIISKQ